MKGTAAPQLISPPFEILGEIDHAGSCVSVGRSWRSFGWIVRWRRWRLVGSSVCWRSWRSLENWCWGLLEGSSSGKKKTPPRQSACKYVCSGWVEHGTISEDGKGQPPPKGWRRLHVEIGDRPHKRCRKEAQGLRTDKRFRDVDPDDRNAKRLESDSGEKEAEGLQNSFPSLGVG